MNFRSPWLKTLAGILAIVAISYVGSARAATITVTCIKPTQNTDGSALTDLAGFRIYGGLAGATKQKLGETDLATGCTFVRPNVSVGTQEYYVTAFNSAGAESAPSNTISVVIADGDGDGVPDLNDACPTVKGPAPTGCPTVPKPPTAVQGQVTAYEYRPDSTTKMAQVGIIKPGVSCSDETLTIGGKTYHSIQYDPATVDYYNSPQQRTPPMKVWALCEDTKAAIIRVESGSLTAEVTG